MPCLLASVEAAQQSAVGHAGGLLPELAASLAAFRIPSLG